jgi:hypothetical protein
MTVYKERIKLLEKFIKNGCLPYSGPKEDNSFKINAYFPYYLDPKEDNSKPESDHDSRQTTPSPVENENMGDTSSSNHINEIHFNSLNDPPQPTSVFDNGFCIYQTPTPSRIYYDFTPNSGTFSAMAQDASGRNSPSGNQHPYPFGFVPVLVPGVVHYFPYWLPSWGGWIASWISWISPPWIWPSFL